MSLYESFSPAPDANKEALILMILVKLYSGKHK